MKKRFDEAQITSAQTALRAIENPNQLIIIKWLDGEEGDDKITELRPLDLATRMCKQDWEVEAWLKDMLNAKLVQKRKQGRSMFYKLDYERLIELQVGVQVLAGTIVV
jgi:DNA-binding transcriptional ArsR family regulator